MIASIAHAIPYLKAIHIAMLIVWCAGLFAVAECRNGKAERITVTNAPSFVAKLDATLEVPGLGTLSVDTAYGGDSFVVVDTEALSFRLVADEARQLAETGVRIIRAANEQLGSLHPENIG